MHLKTFNFTRYKGRNRLSRKEGSCAIVPLHDGCASFPFQTFLAKKHQNGFKNKKLPKILNSFSFSDYFESEIKLNKKCSSHVLISLLATQKQKCPKVIQQRTASSLPVCAAQNRNKFRGVKK